MGLALGITLGQVRNLPYPEYRSWRAYYKLEPWGFQADEYRTASILAMLWNRSITKRSHAKRVTDFMRDPVKAVKEMAEQKKLRKQLLEMPLEERIKMIQRSFGIGG